MAMSLEEQLLAELRAAFGQVERRPDAELFAERADYLWSEGLHGGSGPWWEISADTIAHEPHALGELTIAGFRFFLPAYLSWVIQDIRSGYFTSDTTIYALDATNYSEPALSERRARFASLNSAQHAVVVKFLGWAAAHDDRLDSRAASRALASYWSSAEGDA
jgi:hypothetical protein